MDLIINFFTFNWPPPLFESDWFGFRGFVDFIGAIIFLILFVQPIVWLIKDGKYSKKIDNFAKKLERSFPEGLPNFILNTIFYIFILGVYCLFIYISLFIVYYFNLVAT